MRFISESIFAHCECEGANLIGLSCEFNLQTVYYYDWKSPVTVAVPSVKQLITCERKYFMLTTKAKNLRNSEREAPASDSKRFTVEVEFVLEHSGAEQVYICGDFNGWQPACLRMIGKPEAGLWEKRLPLQPGRYEYKFLVDGHWVHDPDARENVPNVYGSLNSVVDVEPKSTLFL
jgi:hypothetical protein